MSTTVSSTRIPDQELEQVERANTAAASISERENREIEAANASGNTPTMDEPGDHYDTLVSEGAHQRLARTSNTRVTTDETQLLTALTTEQFVLAGARSQAASEPASRSVEHGFRPIQPGPQRLDRRDSSLLRRHRRHRRAA
jgi:hypothetical protein